jgi:hypothetical protein
MRQAGTAELNARGAYSSVPSSDAVVRIICAAPTGFPIRPLGEDAGPPPGGYTDECPCYAEIKLHSAEGTSIPLAGEWVNEMSFGSEE